MPACAAALVLLTAGLLSGLRLSHQELRLRQFAPVSDQELRVLADPSSGVSIASDDPMKIRDWVKSRSSIEVEIPSTRSEAIRLLGAKLVQLRGSLVAAIAYRVGADSATLVVTKAACCNADAGSRHLFSKAGTAGGTALVSWEMRDQAYTIAYAGSGALHGACQLCHAEGRPL
jgi:hypothetical protein